MKDWRQEISNIIQSRCTHDESLLVGNGCVDCQGMYWDVLAIFDGVLDDLAEELPGWASECAPDVIARFKRSIPDG